MLIEELNGMESAAVDVDMLLKESDKSDMIIVTVHSYLLSIRRNVVHRFLFVMAAVMMIA